MGMKTPPISHTVESSRYGQHRCVTRVTPNSIVVEGPTAYTRGAVDDDGVYEMADFEGGPFIARGMSLRLAVGDAPCFPPDGIVKSAKWIGAEEFGTLMGLSESYWVKALDKPNYAYCLVEFV